MGRLPKIFRLPWGWHCCLRAPRSPDGFPTSPINSTFLAVFFRCNPSSHTPFPSWSISNKIAAWIFKGDHIFAQTAISARTTRPCEQKQLSSKHQENLLWIFTGETPATATSIFEGLTEWDREKGIETEVSSWKISSGKASHCHTVRLWKKTHWSLHHMAVTCLVCFTEEGAVLDQSQSSPNFYPYTKYPRIQKYYNRSCSRASLVFFKK